MQDSHNSKFVKEMDKKCEQKKKKKPHQTHLIQRLQVYKKRITNKEMEIPTTA
jgi:hypothetical protein